MTFNLRTQNLNLDSKIHLLVRQNNLDALSSAMLFKSVFKNVSCEMVSYQAIDGRTDGDIALKQYDFVFLINLAPYFNDKLNDRPNHVILSNQENHKHHHNKDKNRYVVPTLSVAKLTQKFLSQFFSVDLSNMNDYIDIVSDFSLWIWKDRRSLYFNWLTRYYKPEEFCNRFKTGDVTFNDKETEYINQNIESVKTAYKSLDIIKLTDKICAISIEKHIDEICHLLFKNTKYRFVFVRLPDSHRVSIRSNYNDIDLGEMMRQFPESGGLRRSASFAFNNEEDYIEKSELMVKLIMESFK